MINNKISNIKSISKIGEKLLYLDEYDKASGFWKYILKYNLDEIGIIMNVISLKDLILFLQFTYFLINLKIFV